MPDQFSVLFLCTGNSCRSQMGEGLLRYLGGENVNAASAGTEPAERVHPRALTTMAQRGIDISEHKPKCIDAFDGQTFDLLISTCDEAAEACPNFAGARERVHWSLPDPAGAQGTDDEIQSVFDAVADELTRRIQALLLERKA